MREEEHTKNKDKNPKIKIQKKQNKCKEKTIKLTRNKRPKQKKSYKFVILWFSLWVFRLKIDKTLVY